MQRTCQCYKPILAWWLPCTALHEILASKGFNDVKVCQHIRCQDVLPATCLLAHGLLGLISVFWQTQQRPGPRTLQQGRSQYLIAAATTAAAQLQVAIQKMTMNMNMNVQHSAKRHHCNQYTMTCLAGCTKSRQCMAACLTGCII
jgi:hypothetical protein